MPVNKILRAVVAVDGDIFLRQIAGQHPGAAFAKPQRHLEGYLGLFHCRAHAGFVIGRVARAFMRDTDAAEPDRQPVALGLGKGRDRVLTCDLTKEYVAINGDYRS